MTIPDVTPRELSVAYWLVQGKTHSETGLILGISDRTVRFHSDKLKARFGHVPLICALIALARAGLVDAEPPAEQFPARERRAIPGEKPKHERTTL